MTHSGALFRVSSGSSATFFGTYAGAGITGTGDLYFEADVTPGFSPAAIDFDGNVNLGATAELKIEIGGVNRGSQDDALNVAGRLALNGALYVSLTSRLAPSGGPVLRSPQRRAGKSQRDVLGDQLAGACRRSTVGYVAALLDWRVVGAPPFAADFDEDGDVDAAT